tara:strand:+ start:1706 stop:1954 length:249 start_codon:yes stop_codon:yes gene_type:complete
MTEYIMYLDGNPDRHNQGWSQKEVKELTSMVRKLEYDNAELVRSNEELRERCKKLASRTPQWPKGYRPRGRWNQGKKNERRN